MKLINDLINVLQTSSDTQLIFIRFLIDCEIKSRQICVNNKKKTKKKEG